MVVPTLFIQQFTRINSSGDLRTHSCKQHSQIQSAEDLYRKSGAAYAKFYKMDPLCKWAWLGAYFTMPKKADGYEDTALIIHSCDGCIDADRFFQKSMETIASPALFVYTLSNIMLGEIAITYGMKGQQTLLMLPKFDAEELILNVNYLQQAGKVEGVLCGWVNVKNNQPDVCLFWLTEQPGALRFTAAQCQSIYNNI